MEMFIEKCHSYRPVRRQGRNSHLFRRTCLLSGYKWCCRDTVSLLPHKESPDQVRLKRKTFQLNLILLSVFHEEKVKIAVPSNDHCIYARKTCEVIVFVPAFVTKVTE